MPEQTSVTTRLLKLLLPPLIPILCLCTCLRVEMNSPRLYTQGFDRYDISAATGLSTEQLNAVATRLIRYFNSLDATPQMQLEFSAGRTSDLFHDYEVIHLADVKHLFAFNSGLQSLALLLVVILCAAGLSSGRRLEVAAALRSGALITLVLLAVTATLFASDFDWMFIGFHLVAFDNSFWQLNPLTDYLVVLFPWGFWQDMSLLAGVATGVMAGTIGMAARLLRRGCTSAPHVQQT